jgi:class 3 adenylate cyclase
MQQIADWLEKLGMSEYAECFAGNNIDASALHHLTDQDLKDLGVSPGHRRKLLHAINELAAAIPSKSQTPAPTVGSGIADRRQLTVMFCDLVGSTALSGMLDPEDLRELIRRYQDAVSGVVLRHGGYVANFLGDGIIAYFGWPSADEDEAAHAVRAGLDAVVAVRELSLQARTGIASGLVVVGDLEAAGRH